jgi:hypothetical protein
MGLFDALKQDTKDRAPTADPRESAARRREEQEINGCKRAVEIARQAREHEQRQTSKRGGRR